MREMTPPVGGWGWGLGGESNSTCKEEGIGREMTPLAGTMGRVR